MVVECQSKYYCMGLKVHEERSCSDATDQQQRKEYYEISDWENGLARNLTT